MSEGLFPLPLTPFEYYFLLEDRAEYAGVIPIELEARGRFDRPAFEQAYRLTHERHPFLSARVEKDKRGWPEFVAGEPEPIRYADDRPTCLDSQPGERPGVRVQVWQDDDQLFHFHFLFHHVAVDGLGAFQFICDLFEAYAHACTGSDEPPPWRPLDPQRLRDRDGHHLFKRRVRPVDLWRMAQVHVPLSLRQAALVSDETDTSATNGQPAAPTSPTDFMVEHLSVEETDALTATAAGRGVMLNDLLVRDYFLTLEEWNRGTSQASGPIRILIPVNMRRREDLRMPAANVFGYAFLTRYAADCQNPEALLDSIRDEMAAVKRDKRALYYEAMLRLSCAWPAFLRWSLNREWSFATAVFTNLGTGFDRLRLPDHQGRKLAGDLLFEVGAGVGPIRPGTRISFSAHNYAGRLAIAACCDGRTLTPVQQRALLDAYLARLRNTIEQS